MSGSHSFPSPPPYRDAVGQFRVAHGGETEAIFEPLYDSQTFKPRMRFFEEPIGASYDNGARWKTRAETNMALAGLLPAPNRFLITGVHFDVTGSDDYRRRVAERGWLRLQLGSKDYLNIAPLGTLMSERVMVRRGRKFVAVPRRFDLDQCFKVTPIMINPQQSFVTEINIDMMPSKQRAFVHLVGYLYRLSQ
jgi:hypothetical protein